MRLRPLVLLGILGATVFTGWAKTVPAKSLASLVTGKVIASGISQPMQYIREPGRPDVAIVIGRTGIIRALVNDTLQTAAVMTITGVDTEGECGLLGLTFDPQFTTNHYFYVHYDTAAPITTRIVRYTMNPDGVTASPLTALRIFSWVQSPYDNHKGGSLNFGADGLLYLGVGDGGSGNDPLHRAQSQTTLFGKMLRIDPTSDDFPADADNNYHVPLDNPFTGVAGARGEIWDFGMRNPFRWSIDPFDGALLIADVGQNAYEEFNYEPANSGGRDYGWPMREGFHATANGGTPYLTPLKDPFMEIAHPAAFAIIGGFIYRGQALPSIMRGRYLYGDEVTNKVWSVPMKLSGGEAQPVLYTDGTDHTAMIQKGTGLSLNGVVSIDPDANGEPIVVELNSGRVLRLIPTRQAAAPVAR